MNVLETENEFNYMPTTSMYDEGEEGGTVSKGFVETKQAEMFL